MLALAHGIQAAITAGQVTDQAEIARRLGFTRARITQLLKLLRLSPDLQERVLFLEALDGCEPLTERSLRAATRERAWEAQKRVFEQLSGDGNANVMDAEGPRPGR
jgi:ParB-like chromosome segregation protein Spo0J